MASSSPVQSRNTASGYGFALGAFCIWGFLPLFWKLTGHINPIEVTAHRALWSLPVAAIILVIIGRTADIIPTLKSPKKLWILFICSVLISLNWGIFIWAITVERTLETALAYYINPLLTVLLGYIFLGERFTNLQRVAIALAALAVLFMTVVGGTFPWVSLLLAGSFGIYGLLRKTVDVGPTQGFLVEVLLIAPFVIGIAIWLHLKGEAALFTNSYDTLLLLLSGPATAIPLILYAMGAKRLMLSTIGILQFLVPTMLFLISIFVFKEPLREGQVIAFIMIWIAISLYVISLMRDHKEAGKRQT